MITDVYDFESVFEPPIAKLFQAQGIISYVSRGRLNDDGTINGQPDFQKDRPRVEVVFTRGSGRKRWHLPPNPQPNIPLVMQARESAWIGNLAIAALTIADGYTHAQFLATVRYVAAAIPGSVDGLSIVNHCINGPISDLGETHQYNREQGYYLTTINYAFEFSVQNTAWALINQ